MTYFFSVISIIFPKHGIKMVGSVISHQIKEIRIEYFSINNR